MNLLALSNSMKWVGVLGAVIGVASTAVIVKHHHPHRPKGGSSGNAPAAGGSPTTPLAKNRTPPQGPYTIAIRGYWTGSGVATVSGLNVKIAAVVTEQGGQSGTLDAELTVSALHFVGKGSAAGQAITLAGRLDIPDGSGTPQDVLKHARIVGTFAAASGHYGRIAGQLAGDGGGDNRTE